MADLMDQANEIQEVLGRNYNVPDDIDEDELLGELDALEDLMAEEETGEEVPSYLQDEALPDAPDLQPLPAAGARGECRREPAAHSSSSASKKPNERPRSDGRRGRILYARGRERRGTRGAK